MFYLLLIIGLVKPQEDNLYAYFTTDGKVFEYATKEEIKCAIETNNFHYFKN